MKFIGKFFAIIFSIIYFFALIGLITVNYSTNFLKGDFYYKVLDSIDLDEIKISSISNVELEDNEDASLKDILVEGLTNTGMDEETANSILENENFKKVIGNIIQEVIDYQLNKENIPEVSKEDIILITSDKNITGDKTFSDEEIEEIQENLNKLLEQIVLGEGFNNDNSK